MAQVTDQMLRGAMDLFIKTVKTNCHSIYSSVRTMGPKKPREGTEKKFLTLIFLLGIFFFL